ncbi:MAG: aminopeptidase P N-terminal domain-containing protein [Bacteroidetes bacterium]|nr:aminopeptidase P N-terminal domain-containing protein [Bacteroidota bacterium]
MFAKRNYIDRRNQLKKDVKSGLILILGNKDVAFNYPANTFTFRQDSNFLYFFGLNHADLAGVIDIDNNKDYIFGNDVDMDDIIWMGNQPTIKEQAAEVGVEHTSPLLSMFELITDTIKAGRKIHFTSPYRGENQMQLADLLGIKYTNVKNYISIELTKAIIKQRSIKSLEEVAEIEKAIATAYEMHTTAMKMAKPGIYEREIAGKMEGIALSAGGPVSFPVILSINGQTLHNHYHGNKLAEGRMMVADAGCETEMNYCSDITRTVPVGGKFNQRQKEVYEIVLKANMQAIDAIKPGIPYREIHLLSAKVIAEGLKEIGLMKGNIDEAVSKGAHAMFYPHGLGHMLGLDVHDMEGMGENYVGYDDEIKRSSIFGTAFLRMGKRLQQGHVLTVEPGIYFIPALIDQWKAESKFTEYINYDKVDAYKDFGGIRIEDDVLISNDGHRVLGKAIPKTVTEIETIMN